MCEAPHICFLQNLHWQTNKILCTTYGRSIRKQRLESNRPRADWQRFESRASHCCWCVAYAYIATSRKSPVCTKIRGCDWVHCVDFYIYHGWVFLCCFPSHRVLRRFGEGGCNIGGTSAYQTEPHTAMGMDYVPKRSRTSCSPRLHACEVRQSQPLNFNSRGMTSTIFPTIHESNRL